MNPSSDVIAFVGLDRLFQEVLKVALSNQGWRVLDPEGHSSTGDAEAEIALVAGSGPLQAVVDRVRQARAQYPAGKVVLIGVEGTEADLVRLIEEGVSGYVSLSDGLVEFIETLQMVRNKQTPSSGRITQLVIRTIRRLSEDVDSIPKARLTLREQEIFRLVQEGLSNKEIASRLRITPNTVKNHIHHLLEKLRVRNRHEAAWLRTKPPRSSSTKTCTGTGE